MALAIVTNTSVPHHIPLVSRRAPPAHSRKFLLYWYSTQKNTPMYYHPVLRSIRVLDLVVVQYYDRVPVRYWYSTVDLPYGYYYHIEKCNMHSAGR